MAYSARTLRMLSLMHTILGVLALITGQVSMKVSPYYKGVFGMGLWIGGWIIITALAGFVSSRQLENYCKIGVFLGCCLVAIVILSICSIILGTVVITHYEFESTVTRSYYKDKGTFGQESHEDYFKPEGYFENRRKEGRVGLAVYGSLLAIEVCDIVLSAICVYVCRDLCRSDQMLNNRPAGAARRPDVSVNPNVPAPPLERGAPDWTELGFPSLLNLANSGQQTQFYPQYKLPNYAELFPEGMVTNDQGGSEPQITPLGDPPPEYTASIEVTPVPQQTSLPGSSIELPSTSSDLSAEESVSEQLGTNLELAGQPPEYPEVLRPSTPPPSVHPGDYPGLAPSDLVTNASGSDCSESELRLCSTPSSLSQGSVTLPNWVETSPSSVDVNTSDETIQSDRNSDQESANVREAWMASQS